MKNYLNIEKSAFRTGEYVGYGAGMVWHISKDGDLWRAVAQDRDPNNSDHATMLRQTLGGISRQLASIDARNAA